MHHGLLTLLRLQYRATGRGMFRGLCTPRGAMFGVLGIVFFLLWLAPNVMMAMQRNEEPFRPETFRAVFPLALLGLGFLNATVAKKQRSIHFTPAETDFLFSAPITRRQLLLYKLAGGAWGLLFASAIMAIVLAAYVQRWVWGWIGLLLSMFLLQLIAVAASLAAEWLGEYAYTRTRRAAIGMAILAVLLVAGLGGTTCSMERGQAVGWLKTAEAIQQSTIGSVLTAPFRPFAMTITAESWGMFALWGTGAVVTNLAMLLLVMRLDVNFLESETIAGREFYERVRRVRRSGGHAVVGTAKHIGRLPMFPRLGGVGPLVRRQALCAMRSAMSFVRLAVVFGFVAGVNYGFAARQGEMKTAAVLPQLAVLTILLARMLPFDFRSDLDHLEWLKTLPVRTSALVVGQLIVPVVAVCMLHVLAAAFLAVAANLRGEELWPIMSFTLPFNALLFATENLIFLAFPLRQELGTVGSFQTFGRSIVEMFAKVLLVGSGCGLAAAAGALTMMFIPFREAAFVVAWLTLAAAAALMIPCVGWAFRRFDVASDIPA